MGRSKNGAMQRYRLGLDLGTNSIGWAAVTLDDDGQPCGVLDMGVRIFPDGRNPTDKTSNAATRRVARGARRRRDRYVQRRSNLLKALITYDLMPTDYNQRRQLATRDPYTLRAKALDHPLPPHELGRALFHLDQRRGFQSNRKTTGDDDDAAKQIGPKIEGLNKSMAASGARTLGEFLARQLEQGYAARFREGAEFYPERAMYKAEFAAIRAAQERHQALSAAQWDTLHEIIFYQRDLKSVEPGWCRFEHQEKRAAKALPVFQEFRMLHEIGNLKLHVGSEPERPLNDGERERALERLRAGKDINLKKPVKALGLPAGATFNLGRGGVRTIIKGDEATARLVEQRKKGQPTQTLFGKRWLTLSLDERNEIVRSLLDTEDPAVVRRKARENWGLTDAQAQAVSAVVLPSGYGELSEKAIKKLLPHLERGLRYSDAVTAADYLHHSDFRNAEAHERLPYYGAVLERDAVGADPTKDPQRDGEVARYGRIGNPTVHIGLGQLRRIINKLIAVYGKPEEIVVELGRDLKANKDDRDWYRRQQREGKARNEKYKEWFGGVEPRPHTRLKLRLWEEQGESQARFCPYTGKRLSFEMVISDQTEIDHILPFSQTLHDSLANKVVCLATANRYKGNQSPYDAFSHNPPGYEYQAILARAAKLPDKKRWRFQPDAMQQFGGKRDFLERQLNETRYLSRTARDYLAYLYDEQTERRRRVRAVPGHMTALLRRGWGLEGMLRESKDGEPSRKQRDDHRHHAIDAFVVACTDQGLLQRFAEASNSRHDRAARLPAVAGEAPPWEGFGRSALRPFLDRLVVSYKSAAGAHSDQTTGQLHNETAYGLLEPAGAGPSKVVTRKQLSAVKRKDLEAMVPGQPLQAALLALWDQVAAEGKKPADFAERAANKGVLVKGQRQRVRRVRVVDKQTVIPIKDHRTGKPYKGYRAGGNEFADIWQLLDKTETWKLVAVPTFDANQPKFDLDKYRPHPAAKRLIRLRIDDMGALGEGPERRIVRVRKITNAQTGVLVFLDDHNEANVPDRVRKKEMKSNPYSARQLKQQGFRKVRVDELGRVRDPGPRAP